MNVLKTKGSLQEIIQTWKDKIICFSPKGEGYHAYLVDSRTGNLLNYIKADCNILRHHATNYDSILIEIKSQYNGYLKEAVLNTIKYEATRRAFKKQHQWIQDSYQRLIEQQKINIEQKSDEIKHLKQIVSQHNQSITELKSECRNNLARLQTDTLLQQKEAELKRKNAEIAQLSQKLVECDRKINHLQSELTSGMNELKLKYKWLIAQFIQDRKEQQQVSRKNKSLQSCQNLFRKAQNKLKNLHQENRNLRQENTRLNHRLRILEAGI